MVCLEIKCSDYDFKRRKLKPAVNQQVYFVEKVIKLPGSLRAQRESRQGA